MATIDRVQLLTDTKFWLPESSTMSDTDIGTIHEIIIAQVGDDDTKYGEVLCKSLGLVARKTIINIEAAASNVKKEKVGDFTTEYMDGQSSSDGWQEFIDSLGTICPLFGYTAKRTTGVKINTGGSFNPLCESPSDFYQDY